MPNYTLTALDTSQIQSYVFGSNRLVENIGASELVERATHQWVYEALPTSNNVTRPGERDGGLDDGRRVPDVAAEIIYAGGGNTVILFAEHPQAVAFMERLTRRILRDAPGLQITVAHRDFEWETEALALAVQETLGGRLAAKKAFPQPSLPLLGQSVTASCASTGLPASEIHEGRRVSREIHAKLSAQGLGEARLNRLAPRVTEGGWEFRNDFDALGRERGEESYLAVVHADGNRMGQRVEAVAAAYATPAQNRAYIEAMRHFSRDIEAAAQAALAAALDALIESLKTHPKWPGATGDFPVRPVVFGGDDVTFVCNARYGLPLAVAYLESFEDETRKRLDEPLYAAAGVTIFKTHYPFARAYRLAEQLCASAKRRIRDTGRDGAAVDWHFAISGIAGDLAAIRRREYRVALDAAAPKSNDANLIMRPVLLDAASGDWRAWRVFTALAAEFAHPDGEWYDRRNKVKALREALRSGPDAVREFIRTYRLDALPGTEELNAEARQTGWTAGRCVYFDAIEMMDLFVKFDPQSAEEAAHAHA